MSDAVVQKLSRSLASGGAYCAWIGLNDPGIAEALAREPFDAIVLDMQHGGVDFVGASRGIQYAALAGKPTLVRINVSDFAAASRVADAGAAGVIAPMINSGEDARQFAEYMKFPPDGRRSWGPRACLPLSGLYGADYLHGANAITLAVAMVETREAIDALDDIVGTPGIDGVFIGPSDLSITLSAGATVDPRGPLVDTAMTKVADAARKHGKFAGLFCFDGPSAKAARARGFAMCSIATDVLLMRAAAKRELDATR